MEAQLVETFILSIINFEFLIASKASRIVNAAGIPIIEFGFRTVDGPLAAFLASRLSFTAGCAGTSNTLASYKFGIPSSGTMAHSFIMGFNEEELAFKEFIKIFPGGFLLIDTYDSIQSSKKDNPK